MNKYIKTFNEYLLFASALLLLSAGANAQYQIQHLEPAFWWAGMKHPELQLLVHGENIAELEPSLDYPGVTVKNVTKTDNPNYLFIDLALAGNVKPGRFGILFKKQGNTQLRYQYRLLEREKGSTNRKSFTPADVIYLITPDRFANGDPKNDRAAALKEAPNRSEKGGRHGGDLQGILNHLDYIADMGFTQIWLNPVLQNDQTSYSYHGYAITDFYRVDARYGTNDLYRKLADRAEKKGIGLIMDMVLNHSGSEHWWMKDLPAKDWINFGGQFVPTTHQRESLRDPHGTAEDRKHFNDGWFVPTMPDLNQTNPLMATYLIQNSIWWVEYAGLSGIRVDTWSYPDKTFLAEWTRRLTEEYPTLNIVGEEWTTNPAIVAYWQRGKRNFDGYQSHLPSLMDFPLQEAVVKGLKEEESWGTGLVRLYRVLTDDFLYPDPYNLVVFPDNHDMSRIFTQVAEDYDLYRIAMTYFLTTRGIPQIFYGTEILMANPGTTDHGIIRSDFPGGWKGDKVNAFTGNGLTAQQKNAQAFVRKLLNWRKTATVVHNGKLTHYAPADNTYVYFRHNQKQKVMVVINKASTAQPLEMSRFHEMVTAETQGVDVISGQKYNLKKSLDVPARSVLVLELH